MNIYGHTKRKRSDGEEQPAALAEVTLVASPAELRRIAAFLLAGAQTMEQMGKSYSHEHLSDKDSSFESSPHLVIASPSAHAV